MRKELLTRFIITPVFNTIQFHVYQAKRNDLFVNNMLQWPRKAFKFFKNVEDISHVNFFSSLTPDSKSFAHKILPNQRIIVKIHFTFHKS